MAFVFLIPLTQLKGIRRLLKRRRYFTIIGPVGKKDPAQRDGKISVFLVVQRAGRARARYIETTQK